MSGLRGVRFRSCLWIVLLLTAIIQDGAPFGLSARGDDPAAAQGAIADEETPDHPDAGRKPKRQLFRGQVVTLPDALKELDIKASEEMDSHVVLKTETGDLIPILADWRGRAFYQDERLRNRDVELVGFQRDGIPYLQVLMVFTLNDDGERQYTDYWCDVCSIPMYEIKPCECCQGDIRLRYQQKELPDYLPSDRPADAAPAPSEGED